MKLLPFVSIAGLVMGPATFPQGGFGGGVHHGELGPSQPNILLIVLDDIGREQLAMYADTFSPAPTTFQPSNPYSCPWPTVAPFQYPRTPNLDRLREGQVNGGATRFTNMYVNPVCSASRACFQTGRYGFRTGLSVLSGGQGQFELDNAEVLLPELLKNGFAAGGQYNPYKCGMFGKWHLTSELNASPPLQNYAHAVQNGYDIFQGMMENVGSNVTNPGDHYNWMKVNSTPASTTTQQYSVSPSCVNPDNDLCKSSCDTPGVAGTVCCYTEDTWNASVNRRDALAWINSQPEPFFACVAFNPPHFPYQLPPFSLLSCETKNELQSAVTCGAPFYPGDVWNSTRFSQGGLCNTPACQSFRKALFYLAMLEAIDTEIGLLIDGIAPGKLSDTVIIVTCDNGTPGELIAPMYGPTHGKSSNYDLGTRVPLIVTGPIIAPGSRDCVELVSAVDLFSTIAAISKANVALANPLTPLDSISFKNLIQNPSGNGTRTQALTQSFYPNGAYVPTNIGPYVPGCAVPPPDDCCVIRRYNAGHGRSITAGGFRLLRLQLTPASDAVCAPDVPPTYADQLYDLAADPNELCDILNPACATYEPNHPMRATLTTALVNLSGQ